MYTYVRVYTKSKCIIVYVSVHVSISVHVNCLFVVSLAFIKCVQQINFHSALLVMSVFIMSAEWLGVFIYPVCLVLLRVWYTFTMARVKYLGKHVCLYNKTITTLRRGKFAGTSSLILFWQKHCEYNQSCYF